MEKIALDAATARRIDENGYLHVSGNRISKATVNPYYGRELPGWEELGLDPQKIYQGFRDPAELEKAAPTFAGIPLQALHHPDSADIPQTEHRVGSVGTDVKFEAPYLVASLTVWNADAIEAIENGTLKLTCSKVGSGKITVRAIAGGDKLGGGDAIGGMEFSREISIVSRPFATRNGGWL